MDDYLRVASTIDGTDVLDFVVQLEVVVDGKLHPAVRFDTAHGFPHVDVLHPDGSLIEKRPLALPTKQALTFAINDIKVHGEAYRFSFLDMARRKP